LIIFFNVVGFILLKKFDNIVIRISTCF